MTRLYVKIAILFSCLYAFGLNRKKLFCLYLLWAFADFYKSETDFFEISCSHWFDDEQANVFRERKLFHPSSAYLGSVRCLTVVFIQKEKFYENLIRYGIQRFPFNVFVKNWLNQKFR